MNIDQLTIGQLKEISAMISPQHQHSVVVDFGFSLAVLDRGFVYVGHCRREGDMLIIESAQNIRYWGTTHGLHQLVNDGPTAKTKLDPPALVRAPWRAVISLHQSDKSKWSF